MGKGKRETEACLLVTFPISLFPFPLLLFGHSRFALRALSLARFTFQLRDSQ